jgi:hypothetical protein
MKQIESKQSSSDSRDGFGTQDDYARMYQLIWGFNVYQIVHTAPLYSLPEHLAQGRATPAETNGKCIASDDPRLKESR